MSKETFEWTEQMGDLVAKSLDQNRQLYATLDDLRRTLEDAGSEYANHYVRYLQNHLEEIDSHLNRLSRYEAWMRKGMEVK